MIRASEFVLNYVVNASWQVAAITIVAAAASFLLRNGPASYRHVLWVTTLALCTVVPLLAAPRAIPANESVFTASSKQTTIGAEADQAVMHLTRRRGQVVTTTSTTALWLTIGYVLLVAGRAIRLLRFWVGKERLRRSAINADLASVVAQVAQRCSVILKTHNVVVVRSAVVRVPCTVGVRRPLIVLPAVFCIANEAGSSRANEDRLLGVIGHEMAHVARHDYLSNLLCELVALPISFHPLTFLIKRQIDRERELACDELVSKHVLPAKLYARLLVWAADLSSQARSQPLLLSMFEARTLEERIMRLTRNRKMVRPGTARAFAWLAMLALCVTTASLSLFSFELKTHARAVLNEALPQRENPTQAFARTEPISAPQSRAERRLDAPTAEARAEAACDAGRSGDVEKIPTLIAMLGDDTKTELLRCWNSGRWSPALETFKHPSPGEQAAIALASMGRPAFRPLASQLDNSNSTVRRNAAWAIGELTNMPPSERDSAVPQLITLLSDSDEWVRMAAARALGELRNESAVPRLIATLSDSEWRVRELAVWALSELKDDRAVTALCGVLLSDSRVEVRRGAAEALGEIHSSEALPSLKQALNDPEVSAKARWAISEIEG
jgi:HEAT repeat protein/beta-lactamase regulating signal transducer with metallopeptidase domain